MLLEIVNLVGIASVVISLMFLVWQTREVARQTRTNHGVGITSTFQQTAQLIQAVHLPMIEDPQLRAYFYDDKECSPSDPYRPKLLTLAELLADAAEFGLMSADYVQGSVVWHNYPRAVLAGSPILREVVSTRPTWWPRLAALLRSMSRPPAEPSIPAPAGEATAL